MMVILNVKELRLTVLIAHITTALRNFNRVFCEKILKVIKKVMMT